MVRRGTLTSPGTGGDPACEWASARAVAAGIVVNTRPADNRVDAPDG